MNFVLTSSKAFRLTSFARFWYLSIFSFSLTYLLLQLCQLFGKMRVACCLANTTRSGLLCSTWWSVSMRKSQSVLMQFVLVRTFQAIFSAQTPMDSFLRSSPVYSLLANTVNWQTMWFTDSPALLAAVTEPTFWAKNLLANPRFTAKVRNAWSWAAVNKPSVSFFNHIQEINIHLLVTLFVCLRNWPCSGFSF